MWSNVRLLHIDLMIRGRDVHYVDYSSRVSSTLRLLALVTFRGIIQCFSHLSTRPKLHVAEEKRG